jgi:class 3 adenylate cyclase/pimeloyl-ACP methyl ester carboxylesterase
VLARSPFSRPNAASCTVFFERANAGVSPADALRVRAVGSDEISGNDACHPVAVGRVAASPLGGQDIAVKGPETRYAWNGDVALAYQVVGEGAIDLLYYQGWSSNIDLAWESPYLSRFLGGLSGHRRLILTDKRGWGCSERFSPSDVPPFEALTDDLLVVMDTVGSERAVLFATVECAAIAVLFAATYPQRVTALILCDPLVNFTATDEAPGSMTQDEWDDFFERVRAQFPQPRWWSGPEDHPEREWFFKYVRAAVTPGALMAEFRRFLATDVRAVLPSVQVPTLVLVDPSGEGDTDPRNGRFAASRIPGASLIEVADPGGLDWHHWYGRASGIVREVGTFMKGIIEEEARFDRVLATVMFTDIVGSAAKTAELGDREWHRLVERHHAVVRGMLARYRGKEIDTAGDGFFASFDGPARAIRCAQAIVDAVRPLGLEVRAGVHTGEVETIDEKLGGIAVVIGARIAGLAAPSEVLASQTVKDLVAGSGLSFEPRGEHELKGVPDRWHIYRAIGAQAATGRSSSSIV